MDQNPWSISYLPSSTTQEESLNNYGGDNPDSLLISSCLPPISSSVEPPATPGLQNSSYDISPIQPSKEEDFFADTLFNGVCKENQTNIRHFVETSSSQNEGTSFSTSENNTAYAGSVPSISFNSSTSERRSPGPFGVLPHEAVMTRSAPRYQDRNNDKFISPVSKTASASYNNGPYTDRDVSSIYSSAPLSAQSAFSGDTASLSPVVNSVTSPSIVSNFSSPSEYYSSPKTNFGAYNSLQSPVPQSPSVAQHSYPSSPFANVDPIGHISSAPPCSPMSAGTYVNNLNAVPQRNGQMSQPSPSNSAANGNIMCFNQPQTPSMVNHGPQPVLPKTDYHSEYGFPHDPNSQSTYSSVYPAIHSTPMSGANSSRMPHRTPMQHQNMQQDGRMPYPHSASQSSASTNYMQNNICHDGYGPSSSVPTGQSMHPPRYPCATPMSNNLSHNMVHTNPSAMMSNQMGSDRPYGYPNNSMDDKKPVNLFNSHLDSSVHHNHSVPPNHPSYMNHEVSHLDANMHPCRQLNRQMDHPNDPYKLNYMTSDNSNRGMMSHGSMGREHSREDMQPTYNMNSYGSSVPRRSRSRNLSLNTPRRRGRRGRRRKSEIGSMTRYQSFKTDRMYSNFPMTPTFLDYGNVETQSTYPKRMCDEKELPPMNYPFSRYRSELKMNLNESEKKSSVMLPKSRKIMMTVEEEVEFLEHLIFPEEEEKESPHTFMKTRNKDSEGFLQCYRNFLVNRKTSSDSDSETAPPGLSSKSKTEHHAPKEHREKRCYKPIPKLVFGRSNNPGEWRLKQPYASPETISDDTEEESASDSSGELISSHKIKQEYDSDQERGKLLKITGKFKLSKHSAKRKNDSNDHDKYNHHKDKRFSNYETLPVGRLQIKTESQELPPITPKKRGRKKKIPAAKPETKRKTYSKMAANSSEVVNDTPVTIKQEIIEDEDVVVECQRRSTRSLSRRSDASIQDTEAGPSIKKEPAELSSDDIDIIDDSDSDPAWTPSAKTLKVGDHIKAHPIPTPVKKRGPKPGRRSSAGNGPTLKVKKEKSRESVPTSGRKRKSHSKSLSCKQETVCEPEKVKKERVCGRFLVAKADIEKPTPYLWLVDTETNMLQRFEWYEQQGIVLYRSTYTYAAWNEISFANYVKAKVKVVSHSRILHVVEYLGPELKEEVENNSVVSKLPANPLRENFEVFLQTLISQALDPNFLSEITNENDEYFLSNIKEIESVSEEKKKTLVKDFWEETLQKCADTYPCVNILDSLSEDETCEVCKKEGASKLLQFYGQPYDWTTLGSVDMILANKTQYTVCVVCSATVSLYSRLHHQKYNFFIKCRTKFLC
ncbi:uncharacterized protein LOC129219756 [Uloborus diversus]|uniref:uncharacterized protein LOC129219756 n=1 Tax=Uloborus diversus TaxID=327109 RepID=UPI00240A07B9|nr:uncharacterized protein LOC129219756 [Uloborus diversus]